MYFQLLYDYITFVHYALTIATSNYMFMSKHVLHEDVFKQHDAARFDDTRDWQDHDVLGDEHRALEQMMQVALALSSGSDCHFIALLLDADQLEDLDRQSIVVDSVLHERIGNQRF